MKFLILGCNGMAGHMISLYLHEQGHDVLGIDRTKSLYVPSVVVNVFDLQVLKVIIEKGQYDAILNCIGILNQSAEEDKEKAVFLNAYLPHFLVNITTYMKTQIIHMSTDCVFSGNVGSYTEESFTDGTTFYDRSKALGEINDLKNLTLRTSIIGPDINVNGIGLLNWFMKQSGEINGFTKSIWTGQTSLQLAKTMEEAVKQKVAGLVNMVPDNSINKFELLSFFNKYFKENKLLIHPIDGVCSDKSLRRTNFDFKYRIPDYETMIIELVEWMRNHKKLYPHYQL